MKNAGNFIILLGISILIVALVEGCHDKTTTQTKDLVRYENDEAVCFKPITDGGFWCHWKADK